MTHHFKQQLADGQAVLGTMLSEVATPNVARMLHTGGFAFLIVDCEHGSFDYAQVAAIAAICNGIGLPVLVRTPGVLREPILKYLEMGADGLLIPMVNTAADVQAVVGFAKYPPLGKRGVSTTRAHAEYAPPPLAEYTQAANERTVVLAQIETCEALANLNAILGVEGLDGVVVGPNDLSMDLGLPGDLNAPVLRDAVAQVIAAAGRACKPSGIITANMQLIKDCRAQGASIFSCNSEAGMLLKASQAVIAEFAQD